MTRTEIELALYHFGVHPTEIKTNADMVERILVDDDYAHRLSTVLDYDARAEVRANLAEGQRIGRTRR
jgi:hypothetical protein